MMKLPVLPMIFFVLISAIAVPALEIDREELTDIPEADIDFENYEGPVDRIDSRDAIRGIGRFLGDGVTASGSAAYGDRYSVRRIVGDPDDPRRGADIMELSPTAGVDHIVNLRRIIAGYLETGWDYGSDDADLIARFITIYNAVHRGSVAFFDERYRSAVVDVLRPDAVGLAISFREWPGRTQLVIPIRDDRAPGDLDAVDPRQLIDSDVIAELRSRADMGIQDRKAIIQFIERVIEERTAAIEEEREAIEEEQVAIDRRREELAAEAPQEEPAVQRDSTPSEETPGPETDVEEADTAREDRQPATTATTTTTTPTTTPAATSDGATEEDETVAEEEAQLDRRQEELDQRREDLAEEEEELAELTEEVETLYRETAEDQAIPEEIRGGGERVIFLIASEGGMYELAVVDAETLEPTGEQTIPLASRDVVSYRGGLIVAHGESGRLLFLDSTSLAIRAESDVPVERGARIRIVDQSVVTVIPEDGGFYLGQFDPQLVLQRRSTDEVRRNTDIVQLGERLIVQGRGGALLLIELQDM